MLKAQHSTQNADRSVESPKGSYDVKRRDAFLAANWPERVAIHDGEAAHSNLLTDPPQLVSTLGNHLGEGDVSASANTASRVGIEVAAPGWVTASAPAALA